MAPNRTHHITHPGFPEGHLPAIPEDTCLTAKVPQDGSLPFFLFDFI